MLTVYSKQNCPMCEQAKAKLKTLDVQFEEVKIDQEDSARDFIVEEGHRTVPQLYLDGKLFVEGGWTGLSKLADDEILLRLGQTNNLGSI